MRLLTIPLIAILIAGCSSTPPREPEPTPTPVESYGDCMTRYSAVRSDCETMNAIVKDSAKRMDGIATCLGNRGFRDGHMTCKK